MYVEFVRVLVMCGYVLENLCVFLCRLKEVVILCSDIECTRDGSHSKRESLC